MACREFMAILNLLTCCKKSLAIHWKTLFSGTTQITRNKGTNTVTVYEINNFVGTVYHIFH